MPTVEERFWSKVDRSGSCWLWTRARARNGYGRMWDGTRMIEAHRWAYIHLVGDPGALDVLHTCDVRHCVNPEHLWLGTQADNMHDMARKGRANPPDLRGFVRGRGKKLTAGQVREIRSRFTGTWGEKASLAREFGITKSMVSKILTGRNWSA